MATTMEFSVIGCLSLLGSSTNGLFLGFVWLLLLELSGFIDGVFLVQNIQFVQENGTVEGERLML